MLNRVHSAALGALAYFALVPAMAQSLFSDDFENPGTERSEAIQLLNRATFGATDADIQSILQQGHEAWLNQQFGQTETYHYPKLEQLLPDFYQGWQAAPLRRRVWWDVAINAPDQLRQRVAFALSQILVVSDQNNQVLDSSDALTTLYDVLVKHAFGNYRDLLEEVTLHPIMGTYLSMRGSTRFQDANVEPDENYAREIMQLFSIGLVQLNNNGTIKRQSGEPIPTYTQEQIIGLAEAFTGWALDGADRGDGHCEPWEWKYQEGDWNVPMKPCPVLPDQRRSNQPTDYHVQTAKVILDDHTIAAGQTAQEDLSEALDVLFNHPNVGPFLAQRLIQRLVTSNPSPAYISRVANAFNNNGSGVRGDLRAVVRAILTDPEADPATIDPTSDFGKLREPLIRVTHLYRAFGTDFDEQRDAEDRWFGVASNPTGFLGQGPLSAPSVFNFYKPDYTQPGEIQDAGLLAPEFQISTESQILATSNFLFGTIANDNSDRPFENLWQTPYRLQVASFLPAAEQSSELVQTVSQHLLGTIAPGAVRDAITTRLDNIPNWANSPERRVRETIFYLATSPQYLIQQ